MMTHRFIMEQKLGRRLRRSECVHHVNGNKEDFTPENLELMTKAAHTAKHAEVKTIEMVELICPTCQRVFKRRKNQTALVKQGNKKTYCSRRCIGGSRRGGLVHGTTTGYATYKCRCELCRAANREKMRKYNEGLRARTGV